MKSLKGFIKMILFCFVAVGIYMLSEELSYFGIFSFLKYKGMDSLAADEYLFNNYYMMDTFAMLIASLLFGIFIYFRKDKYKVENHRDYILNEEVDGTGIILSLIAIMGVKGLINLWFEVLEIFAAKSSFIDEALLAFDMGAGNSDYGEKYIYILLSIVILGPIIEEVLFRGIVYGELYSILGAKAAIILSSVGFAIFHGDLVQITYTVIMGLVLAILYEKYKSISLVILLHLISNFFETLPPFLEEVDLIYYLVYALSMLSILPMIAILINFYKENKANQG